MKKQLLKLSGLLLVVVSLAGCTMPSRGGAGGTGPGSDASSDADATVMAKVLDEVAVETITLSEGDHYNQLYVVGKLQAENEYNVLPYTAGVVEEIMVQVGDHVKAGDVLYVLDSADLITNRDNALQSSQTSKDQAYNSRLLSEKDLQSSQMNLDNATKNYEDNLQLFEGGFITQAAMDGYTDALTSAQISYERSSVSYSNSKISYNQAVTSYENSVVDFENNLSDMTVTSPIDGLVSRIDVQVDVTNNMNAGVLVTGSQNMLVSGSVIEKYVNLMEVGLQAVVEVEAIDKTYTGNLVSVATSSSNSYYPIEVALDNKDGLLKAGMYAGVTIDAELIEGIITVPKTALLSSGSTKFVFTNVDGIAAKVLVQVGRDFGEVVEITEGLTAGDELVVDGQVYLEDGTPLL